MEKPWLRMFAAVLVLSLLLPATVIVCSQLVLHGSLSSPRIVLIGAVTAAALVLVWFARRRLGDVVRWLDRSGKAQADFLDALPSGWVPGAILLSAALSLFMELSVIRWQSAVFPMFALYKNFTLLACFAGLGLGYALSRKDSIPLVAVLPLLLWQVLLFFVIRYALGSWESRYSLMVTPVLEQLNMGFSTARSVPELVSVYLFLATAFLGSAAMFLPVGQLCGRVLARTETLPAYGLNLLGSLLGVLAISGASFLWTPPVVWFAVCVAALLVFQVHDRVALSGGLLAGLAILAALAGAVPRGQPQIFSPYQVLEFGPGKHGLITIRASGYYYQNIFDLGASNANRNADARLQGLAEYYEMPYCIFGAPAGRVAIVGSGTGNDVAAALRCGAGRVDAIEIDPAILELGRLYHPEKPYDDPRVAPIVNDARTFLRTGADAYDLIVYGLLDSHTLLSHASSVRLDSFVYTVEGLSEARQRLKPGGLLSLSFKVISPEIGRKIFLMMERAFGVPPVCIHSKGEDAVIFLQSREGTLKVDDGLVARMSFEDVTSRYADPALRADVSLDDWPFFYMPHRVYPRSYVFLMAFVVALSAFLLLNFFGQKLAFNHPAFFLMGAAFMLIETKGITELGLAFGNTWHVIGIVISAILIMGFLANYAVWKFRLANQHAAFALLLASLALGWVVAGRGGFGASLAGKIGIAVVVTCPMFFSGIVFSSLLRSCRNIAGALAVNMFGAMLGGVLEYNSMYFGFRFLYVLAAGLYAAAWISALVVRRGNGGSVA